MDKKIIGWKEVEIKVNNVFKINGRFGKKQYFNTIEIKKIQVPIYKN